MFTRKRTTTAKKSSFPVAKEFSKKLKNPFADKSNWFREIPASEWVEKDPKSDPPLPLKDAPGIQKETLDGSSVNPNELMETFDFREDSDKEVKDDEILEKDEFFEEKEDDYQIPSTPVKNSNSFLNVSTPTPLRIFSERENFRRSKERKRSHQW
jgi:hypothetical protein